MKNDIAAQDTSIAFFYYQSKHFLTAKTGCLETPEKWTIFKVEELDWPRASEPHASQVLSAPLATHSTLLLRKKRGKTFDLAQQFHMLQASGKIVLTGLIWILWPYSNTVFENIEKVLFNIASEASYVYLLSGQRLFKNANFGDFLKTWRLAVKQCYRIGHF